MTSPRMLFATLAILLMLTQFIPAPPGGPGDATVVDEFKGGAAGTLLQFNGPGVKKDAQLSLEQNVSFTTASVNVTGMANGNGKAPWNVTLDLGDDNKMEWRFKGEGVGAWGKQTIFNTSMPLEYVMFDGGGSAVPVAIRLPKGAVVKSASMDLTGDSLDIHFLSLSSSLTSQESDDIGRLQGMGYAVASTPASNNIQPQGSCIAFTEDLSSFSAAIHNVMASGVPVLIFGKGVQALDNLGLASSGSWRSWGGGCNSFVVQANYAGIMNGLNINQSYTPFTYIGSNQLWGVLEPPSNQWCGVNLASFLGSSGWDVESHMGVADPATHNYLTTWSGPIDSKVFFSGFYCFPNTIMTTTWNTIITNAVDWMIGGASSSGPQDVSLKLGPTGAIPVWSHPGELSTQETTDDFASGLNTYMATAQTAFTNEYGVEYVDVPLNLTTTSGGRIRLDNLSVEYDYTATVDVTDALDTWLGKQVPPPGGANWTIDLAVHSDSGGDVLLDGLHVGYDGPPVILSSLPTTLECWEDTPAPYLLDLSLFAVDDFDDPAELTYTVKKNTLSEYVDVFITDGHWLGADPSVTPDWNSDTQSEGLLEVRLEVTDSDNNSVLCHLIFIHVLPVNDEPVPGDPIPPLTIVEGQKESPLAMNTKAFFTDVEFDPLHYMAVVDPLEEVEGEEGNVTAEIDPLSRALTVEALGDYFTPDGVSIPIWVYADDDNVINTMDDGYLDAGESVPNWTHQVTYLTVVNENDAPVWADIPDLTSIEDVPVEDAFRLVDFVTDIDSDPEDWEFKLRSNSNKKLKVSLDPDTTGISLEPAENAFGSAKVEVEVSDGEDKTRATFRVVVDPVNDLPEVTVYSPMPGSALQDNVTLTGSAADVENTLAKVELSTDGGTTWVPVLGLATWTFVMNTALFDNGPITLLFRAFDGEEYSPNATLDLVINNPINQIPAVLITQPSDGAIVPPGMLTIKGTSSDLDGVVKKVTLRLGDGSELVTLRDPGTGLTSWIYEVNASRWAGQDVTIVARAYDGQDHSPEANVTFSVEAFEEPPDIEGGPGKEGESGVSSLAWLWALIAVIAVMVVVLLLVVMKSKKDRELEEEEEARRKEEAGREEKEAADRAAALGAQLRVATPAGPPMDGSGWSAAGAGGAGAVMGSAPPPPAVSAPPLPPPMPAPPPPLVSAPLPPTQVGGAPDIPLLPPAPPSATHTPPPSPPAASAPAAPPPMAPAPPAPPPVAPTPSTPPPVTQAPPPPPSPPAPTAPPPPGGAPPVSQVSCYVCGGMVPITSTQRPLSIQCPSCGAQGEI